MNLKEAFRFQNKLQSMMADAQSILGNNGNIIRKVILAERQYFAPPMVRKSP